VELVGEAAGPSPGLNILKRGVEHRLTGRGQSPKREKDNIPA